MYCLYFYNNVKLTGIFFFITFTIYNFYTTIRKMLDFFKTCPVMNTLGLGYNI